MAATVSDALFGEVLRFLEFTPVHVALRPESAARALSTLGFMPTRVEIMEPTLILEFVGLSPYFSEVMLGREIPAYTFEVHKADEGDFIVEVRPSSGGPPINKLL